MIPAETLAEAREIAIRFALPGMYDGISSHATRRGDADDKPYMRAILAALTRRANGDAGASATCAAVKQGTAGGNEPADCDWPVCGCDLHADRVIAALEESGHLKPPAADAIPANATYTLDDSGLFCRHCGKASWRHYRVTGVGNFCTPKPPAGGDAGAVDLPEAGRLALMYLETGFIECPQCGHEVPTKDVDAIWQLKDGLAAFKASADSSVADRVVVPLIDQHGKQVGVEHLAIADLYRREVYVDENGTTWTPPTAWAYMQACRAIDPKPHLIERRIDDDCGCPEEEWEAFGAHLHMHLNAGQPSDAHADYGDAGEAEMSVTADTHELARAAIFGWAREMQRPGGAAGS